MWQTSLVLVSVLEGHLSLAARLGGQAKIDLLAQRRHVIEYLSAQGQSRQRAIRVADGLADAFHDDHDLDPESIRKAAGQLLSIQDQTDFLEAYREHMNTSQFVTAPKRGKGKRRGRARKGKGKETLACGTIKQARCSRELNFAWIRGRFKQWAGEAYYDITKLSGKPLSQATQDDFQKLFFCHYKKKCKLPPCQCSKPPCGECEDGKVEKLDAHSGAAFKAECHNYPACVGIPGECCPQLNGTHHACCKTDLTKIIAQKKAGGFEFMTKIPGQELSKAVMNGKFLGPLRNSHCGTSPVIGGNGSTLEDCAKGCDASEDCAFFSFGQETCKFHAKCHIQWIRHDSVVYVKNTDGMTPELVPPKNYGDQSHFFLIGDWGSLSCPARASMHYAHPHIEEGSDRWNIDHNAQSNVARVMGEVGAKTKPFLVVNAGDNFYWGGINHWTRGGRGIYDKFWKTAFEDVYSHSSLQVPWLGVLGNHDYGGDGCFADIQAQFDYTFKDMTYKNRWKMPGPYFSHLAQAGGTTIEYFMLDSNIEDSRSGRNGGICKQTLCGGTTVDYDACTNWFSDTWRKQQKWFATAIKGSAAKWKVVVMHHKPHGHVGGKILPVARNNKASLIVGSHTHEMAFCEQKHPPMMVVGAGGGAQANPGCGGCKLCTAQYGFGDIEVTEEKLISKVYLWDGRQAYSGEICQTATGGKMCKDIAPSPE